MAAQAATASAHGAPWIVTCSCGGLVRASDTLEEATTLVAAHKEQASAGLRHAIVIKGSLDLQHTATPRGGHRHADPDVTGQFPKPRAARRWSPSF